MNILCIIPARGGSKGIKNKNLLTIDDMPLVEYSIKHSLESKYITRTIVSTDSEAIQEIALKAGAEVPFLRPKELAEDHILDLPVFEHALNFLEKTENYKPNLIVHLRPTTPYRKSEWIDEAILAIKNTPEADSIRSVSKPSEHPYRIFRIDKNGYLDALMKSEHPHPYLLRRQDHPDMYHYNCVIDITKPNTLLKKKSMTGDQILPYIMDPQNVIDIDSQRDYQVAKFLMENKLL